MLKIIQIEMQQNKRQLCDLFTISPFIRKSAMHTVPFRKKLNLIFYAITQVVETNKIQSRIQCALSTSPPLSRSLSLFLIFFSLELNGNICCHFANALYWLQTWSLIRNKLQQRCAVMQLSLVILLFTLDCVHYGQKQTNSD